MAGTQILTSTKMLLRDAQMNQEFKRLVLERISMTAVIHDNTESSLRAITMHTKFAIFDGYKVILFKHQQAFALTSSGFDGVLQLGDSCV